jgi:hypothetical protein
MASPASPAIDHPTFVFYIFRLRIPLIVTRIFRGTRMESSRAAASDEIAASIRGADSTRDAAGR